MRLGAEEMRVGSKEVNSGGKGSDQKVKRGSGVKGLGPNR